MSWRLLRSPRLWLAGPVAFVLAVLVMLGMAVWFPKGVAGLNNVILPLIAFPLIWAAIFFYAYLDRNTRRVALAFVCLALVHVVLLTVHFTG